MNTIKIATVVIALGFVSLVAFTNCSKVEFQAASESNKTSGTPTFEEAVINCSNAAANGKLVVADTPIRFEDPKIETNRTHVCEFAQGDNLAMAQDLLTARYEQTAVLPLPENAVLCGAEISSTAATFSYDDMFYLMMNDYVVASSLKGSLSKLAFENITSTLGTVKAYKYDWLSLRSSKFTGVNEMSDNYCFGDMLGAGGCQWPNSQKNGPLSMKFDQSLIIALGLKSTSSAQTLKFVVTGDNDPADDCRHERLDFQVKFSYYLAK